MNLKGLLIALLFVAPCFAVQPRFPNPSTPDEVWQNDRDLSEQIKKSFDPLFASSGTISYFNSSTATVANLTATNITATNITATSSGTITNLNISKIFATQEVPVTINGIIVTTFSTNGMRLLGTITNDNAAMESYGAYFSSIPVQGVSVPTTAQWGDHISSAVIPGDWSITYCALEGANAATVTRFQVGISSVAGNSTTNLVQGVNQFDAPIPLSGVRTGSFCFPDYRVTVAASTTQLWYMKIESDYSAAVPMISGSMHMTRRR